jgi:hypothetical protein
VTVSAPAIAPSAKLPAVAAGDAKAAATDTGATFHAVLDGTQSGPKPVRPAKTPTQKSSSTDLSRAALLQVFDVVREILAFGQPLVAEQIDPGATPADVSVPDAGAPAGSLSGSLSNDAPGAAQVISILGTALSQQLAQKSAIPVSPSQEQTPPTTQSAFALKLSTASIPSAPTPTTTGPSQSSEPAARDAALLLLSPVIAQVKPGAEGPAAATPKIEPLFSTSSVEPPAQSATPADSHSAPPARVERPSEIAPLEPPRAPVTSPREITVRLADLQQRATDVRFVERGGQVHVSVRSADADFARTLRGGLNDLMTRLDHAGIRAELTRPGSENASFKNDSRPQDQPSGSGSRRDQKERQQNGNPQTWMEEFQKQSNPEGEQTV